MITCPQCFHTAGDLALVCPACNGLIHARALEEIADRAKTAEAGGDPEALMLSQRALQLLPQGTRQHAAILERVAALQKDAGKTKGPAAAEAVLRFTLPSNRAEETGRFQNCPDL